MAGSETSIENLSFSIETFSEALAEKKCEHFLFFGSLLGIVRENSPIKGDDDVDFYVNKKHYRKVVCLLRDMGVNIDYNNYPNDSGWFIQVQNTINGREIRVDFYFYDADTDENFILEYWNFTGSPENTDLVLKIPKPLLYPIRHIEYRSCNINIPQHPIIVCEFLYGINWRTPQRKGVDYGMTTLGGRPLRFFSEGNNMSVLP